LGEGTGGETLDPVVTATVTTGTGETNMEDPTGNPNFNALNLEAGATGNLATFITFIHFQTPEAVNGIANLARPSGYRSRPR
jgi:hypothetical protein